MKIRLSDTQKKLLLVAGVSGTLTLLSLVDDIGTEFELYRNVINNHADQLVQYGEQIQKVASNHARKVSDIK
ncbi:MAG: hypothetical protein NC548_05400 [Lachnospiraceae bacterium]|nr:hypothetical protein [Lachnospiraceae bacterium]